MGSLFFIKINAVAVCSLLLFSDFWFYFDVTQLTFTCSQSTTETLEKGMKYVQITIKAPERRQ